MVKTYKSSFISAGVYKGIVKSIEAIPNDYYNPEEDESAFNCPETLEIEFKFKDGQTFKQAFVNPSQDYGLFGDLCAVYGAKFNNDPSEDFDEKELIGLECAVGIEDVEKKSGKNKGKSFTTAVRASAIGVNPFDNNPNATEEEKEEASKKEDEPAEEAEPKKKVTKKKKEEVEKEPDLTPEKQKATVDAAKEVFGLDTNIEQGLEPGEFLVPSESTANKTYFVYADMQKKTIKSCDCTGFKSHGKCKHGNRVLLEKVLG